jgi:O-acetylhomoserine/O-acetylserine sulfhydrylase-like pyridoxal-dependent enzyme
MQRGQALLRLIAGFAFGELKPWLFVLRNSRFETIPGAIFCQDMGALDSNTILIERTIEVLIGGVQNPPQANAQKIAEFLASHPRIPRVNYAGLPGHTGQSLHFSQVSPTCLLSVSIFATSIDYCTLLHYC